MSDVNHYRLAGICVDPSVASATTWEHKSMHESAVKHSQLEIAAERRGAYGLPFDICIIGSQQAERFDLDQSVLIG